MILDYRKIFQKLVYYILPVGLFLTSFLNVGRSSFFLRLGDSALSLLGVILFIKPLAVIFEYQFFWKIVSYRRELGILNFWLFFFHAAGLAYLYGFYDPNTWDNLPFFVYWGIAAGIGMFAVVSTSNDYAVKLLKRNWKKVQSLTYLIFLFSLSHLGILRDQLFLYLSIFFLFVALKAIEYKKVKNIALNH